MSNITLPGLETLFKDSFQRFTSRFLSYFLAYVIGFGIGIAMLIVAGLLFLLHIAIFGTTQSMEITVTSALITGVAFLVAGIYLQSWVYLVMVDAIIQAHPTGIIASFKRNRQYIWGFVWYAIVSWLLITGIVILGLLGIVIGALILALLWGAWNAFGPIIYVEKHYRGLTNLWASYHLVNTKFWPIVGRFVLIFLAVYIIYFMLGAAFQDSPAVLTFLNIIVGLIFTPFLLSYTYEIYRHLPQEHPTTPSTPWIVTSIIGWVIVIGFVILSFAAGALAVSEVLNEIDLSDFEEEAIMLDDTQI